MPQTTIDMDAKTLETIAELKRKFNVKTNAQVIRRALALARVASRNSGQNDYITLLGQNDEKTTVVLSD
jgi:hypothetical protein